MKKIRFISIVTLLCAIITFAQTECKAKTVTVPVTSNSASGITDANLTATLDDGTILGFRRSGSTAYFCGAISQQTELTIPDSILISSNRYAVNIVGYNRCDFDKCNLIDIACNHYQSLLSTCNGKGIAHKQLYQFID